MLTGAVQIFLTVDVPEADITSYNVLCFTEKNIFLNYDLSAKPTVLLGEQ